MADLGTFSEGFLSFRRTMAAVPSDARLPVFVSAASEAAEYVRKGLDRTLAADELADMAVGGGLDDIDAVQWVIARAFEKIDERKPAREEPRVNGHGAHKQEAKPQSATLYQLPDPTTIPPRGWLHVAHYIRGVVSATVAPGGFGKTTLTLHEALTMASSGLRVWYISAEDDIDEINRRIAAWVREQTDQRAGVAPVFDGNLFVDDKMSFPFKIARLNRNGLLSFNDPGLLDFESAIEIAKIDAVILDPFISFHYVPENDTAGMDAVVKRLGEIATRRKCSIELSHHVRKPGANQFEITVHDARGAGAIVNAVRSCRVLNQMSKAFADEQNIPVTERSTYIRIDSGKQNLSKPEAARWMQLISVDIANGDKVQALKPFIPTHKDKATEEEREWLLFIFKSGATYRKDPQSEEWFGHKIAEHYGRIASDKKDRSWINSAIGRWKAKDWISVAEITDGKRIKRPIWQLGPKIKVDVVEPQHVVPQRLKLLAFEEED
jgi:hypothetical protein